LILIFCIGHNMSEPLPTIVTAGATVATGLFVGLPPEFLWGLASAFAARVLVKNDRPTTVKTYAYAAVSLVASATLAGMFGGAVAEFVVSHGWFSGSVALKASSAAIGIGAQSIVEAVQAFPKLAQAKIFGSKEAQP
jgi:hypothetical protein